MLALTMTLIDNPNSRNPIWIIMKSRKTLPAQPLKPKVLHVQVSCMAMHPSKGYVTVITEGSATLTMDKTTPGNIL